MHETVSNGQQNCSKGHNIISSAESVPWLAPGTGGGAGAGMVAVILKWPIGHGGGSLNFLDLTLSGVTFESSTYDVRTKRLGVLRRRYKNGSCVRVAFEHQM